MWLKYSGYGTEKSFKAFIKTFLLSSLTSFSSSFIFEISNIVLLLFCFSSLESFSVIFLFFSFLTSFSLLIIFKFSSSSGLFFFIFKNSSSLFSSSFFGLFLFLFKSLLLLSFIFFCDKFKF